MVARQRQSDGLLQGELRPSQLEASDPAADDQPHSMQLLLLPSVCVFVCDLLHSFTSHNPFSHLYLILLYSISFFFTFDTSILSVPCLTLSY